MKFGIDKRSVAICDAYVTDKKGIFWKIREVLGDGSYVCVKVVTRRFTTGLTLGLGAPLPWDKVGVKV